VPEPADVVKGPTDTGEAKTFEAAFRRLEEVVRRLEGEGLSLDEALTAYEEGAALADYCAKMLESAELRLARLSPSGNETDLQAP
jgi:exodeoxyribonuclease VII small subunit